MFYTGTSKKAMSRRSGEGPSDAADLRLEQIAVVEMLKAGAQL